MSVERQIACIDANSTAFQRSLGKIKDPALRKEIKNALRSLLLQDVKELPAKLKFHQLHNKLVASGLDPQKKVPAWSCHVTGNDVYKASFTFEGETLFLRRIGPHDEIDESP